MFPVLRVPPGEEARRSSSLTCGVNCGACCGGGKMRKRAEARRRRYRAADVPAHLLAYQITDTSYALTGDA
jgi:hypothetical protein